MKRELRSAPNPPPIPDEIQNLKRYEAMTKYF